MSFIIIGSFLLYLFDGSETIECPVSYNNIIGGCYKIGIDPYRTWSDARHYCLNESLTYNITNVTDAVGHLVVLENELERNALFNWMRAWEVQQHSIEFWIDGIVSSSSWSWSKQSITLYFYSDERAVIGNGKNFKLVYNSNLNTYKIADDMNSKLLPWICELQIPCNGNNTCQNNAICYLNMAEEVCLCPACFQGEQCELSSQAFGFTLDSLLVDYSETVKIIYAVITFLLFSIGFFDNFCSLITFKRPTPRKFGVGNYLFIVACLNQIALFCLLFKFIQITTGDAAAGSCKAVSYLLSVFTRSINWLTSWITVDRLLIILFPTSSSLKNPCVAIGISTVTLTAIFGMHVHEIFYSSTIEHRATNLTICVTNFDTRMISTYNRISTIIHYLVPFFIQIICITFLIILASRSRVKTVGQGMTFGQVLKKQFQTQKELYITPLIIILSALPQVILTFSFTCTQMTNWQRHALLGSYLLSYAPQVLGFILFVMPSTSYKKEFGATILAKKCFKSIFDK